MASTAARRAAQAALQQQRPRAAGAEMHAALHRQKRQWKQQAVKRVPLRALAARCGTTRTMGGVQGEMGGGKGEVRGHVGWEVTAVTLALTLLWIPC